jgi:hypothetical protein
LDLFSFPNRKSTSPGTQAGAFLADALPSEATQHVLIIGVRTLLYQK